jgi:hypothetical protein
MKLPLWFKVIWWLLLCCITSFLFYKRIPAIEAGQSAPIDVFIFLVLVVLLLAPVFQEVSFFGLKFKQAVDELQKQLVTQLTDFKSEIKSTITTNSNVSVTIPPPPSDDQLPEIEDRIKKAVSQAFEEQGFKPSKFIPEMETDDKTLFLFKIRHAIESKLRKIAEYTESYTVSRRPLSINQLTDLLVRQELLHPKIANAIREIYSVCSPAIHGEPVSDAQVAFVRDVSPQVVEALTQIEHRTNR